MRLFRSSAVLLVIALVSTAAGCARQDIRRSHGAVRLVTGGLSNNAAVAAMAPAFLIYDADEATNRIGKPSARFTADGKEDIFVDPDHPVFYTLTRTFETGRGRYTNYIYRVHFPGNPFSLIPFRLVAGKNSGLIVIVTADADGRPVLVTTVHTCGCYLAIVPTNYLPKDALPDDWTGRPIAVYGETLPARLDYSTRTRPRLLIHLRPGEHRVAHLEVVAADDLLTADRPMDTAQWAPLRDLERLPLGDGTTGFFYDSGRLKGHVKGAQKPFETLFLGIISWDAFVGTDKKYADRAETGNPFYTSLLPWNRIASDMWPFETFLKFWGWKL